MLANILGALLPFFASDRSSRNVNVHPFVWFKLVQSSQSSSFWLKSSSNQSGISKQSVSTQRAFRELSESTQRSEHQNKSQYSRSLKYCVLFKHHLLLKAQNMEASEHSGHVSCVQKCVLKLVNFFVQNLPKPHMIDLGTHSTLTGDDLWSFCHIAGL